MPAGAQLVGDCKFSDGETKQQLQKLPLGACLDFHPRHMGPRTAYLETCCGASPGKLVDNARMTVFLGIVTSITLFRSSRLSAALVYSFAVLIYASPAVCVFLAPQLAKWFHIGVSVTLSMFCVLVVTLTPNRGAATFCLVPLMCFTTHFLLHRRPQRLQLLTFLFTAFTSLVLAVLCVVSFGATYKSPIAPSRYDMSRNFSFPPAGTRNPYPRGAVSPACSMEFPTSNRSRHMHLVDFALLSKFVYEPDGSLKQMVHDWGGEWELVKEQRRELGCTDDRVCNTRDWASWFVFDSLKEAGFGKTTIVTIRGTKTELEMMFDLNLWALQIFGLEGFTDHLPFVGPVFNSFWTSRSVGKLWFRGRKERYRSVYTYLHKRLEAEPHRQFYLTGHSLGGGLAQLLAAELGVPAVTFSSPPSVETAGVLGLDTTILQGLVVNVMPDRDPITNDKSPKAGTNVPIVCKLAGTSCHRIYGTICELFRECGDTTQRTFPCEFCGIEAQKHFAVCAKVVAGRGDVAGNDGPDWPP